MRLCDHAAAVPADLRTHSAKLCSRPWRSHRYSSSVVVDAPVVCNTGALVGSCRNCGVSAVAVLGVVQFLDKVVVPVGAMTGGSRNAWFDDGYMLCIIQGCSWKNFTIFYMIG